MLRSNTSDIASAKAILIHFPNETKAYPFKSKAEDELDSEIGKITNELLKDEWKIISTDHLIIGTLQIRTIHFERTKQ